MTIGGDNLHKWFRIVFLGEVAIDAGVVGVWAGGQADSVASKCVCVCV